MLLMGCATLGLLDRRISDLPEIKSKVYYNMVIMKKGIKIENTALLVIDVINFCCHPKCGDSFAKIRKMVPRLKKFVSKYRKAGGQNYQSNI